MTRLKFGETDVRAEEELREDWCRRERERIEWEERRKWYLWVASSGYDGDITRRIVAEGDAEGFLLDEDWPISGLARFHFYYYDFLDFGGDIQEYKYLSDLVKIPRKRITRRFVREVLELGEGDYKDSFRALIKRGFIMPSQEEIKRRAKIRNCQHNLRDLDTATNEEYRTVVEETLREFRALIYWEYPEFFERKNADC